MRWVGLAPCGVALRILVAAAGSWRAGGLCRRARRSRMGRGACSVGRRRGVVRPAAAGIGPRHPGKRSAREPSTAVEIETACTAPAAMICDC